MSDSQPTSSTVSPPAPDVCSIPDGFRHLAVRYVEESAEQLFWAVLNAEWHVMASNAPFRRTIIDRSESENFLETLSGDLASDLRRREEEGILEGREIELLHELPSGSVVVSYRFYSDGNRRFVCGRDMSEQMELVAQLSVMVEGMGNQVQQERENATQLRQELEIDDLTQLSNRRRARSELESLWNDFAGGGSPFAAVMIDIDHFKAVNDTYGHPAGDEVLRRVSKAMTYAVRDCDVVARFGGEEFLVLAPGADARVGKIIGDRIRKKVEKTPMPSGIPKVTVSVGVASVADVENLAKPSELLSRADFALYDAKRAGRNQVVVAPSS
ncbi:MAG: GGDEF domain-containing protein [Planctomycetota bacterium]